MKKTRILNALTGALLILLWSCATGPYVQKEDKVSRLVDLINRGEVNKVEGLSSAPFLLDGELILLQSDLTDLWTNLKVSGFMLKNVKILQNSLLKEGDYRSFGETMEIKTFFKKYLDKNTSLVKLGADGGSYYLLLNKEVEGYPRIQGLRGPVQ